MKSIVVLFLLTVCLALGALSQERFGIELVGGRLFNKTQGNGLTAFGDGFSVGSGLSYDASEQTQIGLRVVYSEMPYTSSAYYGVRPAAIDKITSLFFQGEKASSFETSVGLKFTSETSLFVRPYLFIRGGLYFTKTEKKKSSYRIVDDIRPPTVIGTSSTNGFGAIGAGLKFSLLSELSLNVEAAIHKFFAQNSVLVPFLITTCITM